MSESFEYSYDKIAYPSLIHLQTHPDRLATIGALLGLNPQNPANCRVLEIGCGDGTNSIALADSLPESEFVAVDLSEKQIKYGNSIINSIGLSNLKLLHADILNLNRRDLGIFDYIIAHGVYSWTPEIVRDKVLELCRQLLSEQGIAFLSYNALPGFHLRQMARDIAIYHTRKIKEPEKKITEAVNFLSFLSKTAVENEIYRKAIADEFEAVVSTDERVVCHDLLEEDNVPVYFHKFIAHAEKHKLKFLSEIEYFTKKDINYNSVKREFLKNSGDDIVRAEQYIDFIANRRFRQTLLCRREVSLKEEPDIKFLRNLQISADIHAKSENCSLEPKTNETFICLNDFQFQVDHALTKAALIYLGKIYPDSISFEKLIEKARQLLESKIGRKDIAENDEQILCDVLLQIYNVHLVKIFFSKPVWVGVPGEKPLVRKYIKWQAQNGLKEFTTLRLEILKIEDEFARKLLVLLDGTRTREDILRELKTKAEIEIENKEKKLEFINNLPELLEEHLKKLANFGLFLK